jgi:hypothetical protein
MRRTNYSERIKTAVTPECREELQRFADRAFESNESAAIRHAIERGLADMRDQLRGSEAA